MTASGILAQAGADLSASADLNATGAGGIQLQSDNNQVILSANVAANLTSGAVILSSPQAALDSIVPAVISGRSLTITEGRAAAAAYTISTNVAVFTGQNVASNVTVANAKALTVGTGATTTYGDSLAILTTTGDLTISGPVIAAAAGAANISLGAAGTVTITSSGASIQALNRTIAITAGGAVQATALLDATGTNGLVDVQAGTGINLGNNFRASNLSAVTTTGNVVAQSTLTTPLSVLNAVTGSGTVALQSTSGNLVLAGTVSSGSGSVTARSTAANVSVQNTATVTAPGGTVTLQTDTRNIDINGTINTLPGGTVVLTASNATGGVISSGSAANITTGTLNYTASNASAILNTATYTNLAVKLTKSGENLTLVNPGTLNLLAVTVNNGFVDISANGGLTVTGAVNVGTAQNVSVSSVNGSVAGPGLITGNVLNVVANTGANLTTNVTSLTAKITGATGNLTIAERSGLQIAAGNVTTAGGFVNITAGTAAVGTLSGSGLINAAGGNVSLTNSNGSVTLTAANQVTGNVLTVAASGSTALNTNVSTLIANITGTGQTLTINEANSLTAIGQNVQTNNGDISINLATGNLTGPGSILAGTGRSAT
ncbi:MAG: S-layer family protein [Planctomycetia bacterium]|nr:S-layer family protein [Planctomycetia bacterium]